MPALDLHRMQIYVFAKEIWTSDPRPKMLFVESLPGKCHYLQIYKIFTDSVYFEVKLCPL